MKSNDVIECFNRALDIERESKGVEVYGHFVCVQNVIKRIGDTKTFQVRIDFVNKYCIAKPVISRDHTMPCPIDKVEDAKELVLKMCLPDLFALPRLGAGKVSWEHFVNGDYEGWS